MTNLAPAALHHYGAELAGGTPAKRLAANQAALALMAQSAPLTTDQKKKLMAYSGLGGVGASKDQYYTPTPLARLAWHCLIKSGVPVEGKILEPSCGSGVFMYTAPAGVEMVGVELDSKAASIADKLWGEKHTIHNQSFERFAQGRLLSGLLFDGLIGNVPFGIRASIGEDKMYRGLTKHELYFLQRGLDVLKDGGVLALIIPASVLTHESLRGFRSGLLARSEVLGAFRISSEAFKASGAAPVTDLLILRKGSPTKNDAFIAGKVFEPGQLGFVLGTSGLDRWGESTIGPITTDMLRSALSRFNPPAYVAPAVPTPAAPVFMPAPVAPLTSITLQQAEKAGQALVDLIRAQKHGEDSQAQRIEAKEAVQAFVSSSQSVSDLRQLKKTAKDSAAVSALLAAMDTDHGPAILSENTYQAPSVDAGPLTPSESIQQALNRSLDGTVSEEALAGDSEALALLQTDVQYIPLPDKPGYYTTLERFASGAVYEKLDLIHSLPASVGAEWKPRAIEALKAAMKHTPLDQAHISLRDRWISDAIKNEFLAWYDQTYSSNSQGNMYSYYGLMTWNDAGFYQVTTTHREVKDEKTGLVIGTEPVQWTNSERLEKYLNHRGLGGTADEKERRIETIRELDQDFRDWILSSQHQARLQETYNRSFNGFVQPVYSLAPLTNPKFTFADKLHGYQNQSIRKRLDQGKGINGLDVGLGKTLTTIAEALLYKSLGRINKPAIVVPKSVFANWKEEIDRSTNGAAVLYIGEKFKLDKEGKIKSDSMTASEREIALKQAAMGNWDLIIFADSAFELVPLSPEELNRYGDAEFYADTYGLELSNYKQACAADAHTARLTLRQFMKASEQTYFDDLGIDALFYDEADQLKNMKGSKQGGRINYLPSGPGSKRAYDFNAKAAYLGNKHIIPMSATPTKNSPLEIYAQILHVAPEEWRKRGIYSIEHFIDHYCQIESKTILSPAGVYVDASCLVGFKNVINLREILFRYVDLRSAAEVGLKLPRPETNVSFSDMDSAQKADYEDLRLRALTMKREDGSDDHIFRIMHEMEQVSFCPQLRDPIRYAPDYTSPKMLQGCQQVAANLAAGQGGQIIFTSDLFVQSHAVIKSCLVRLGVPAPLIAIVNGITCKSSSARQRIAKLFNQGKLKVIIGNDGIIGQGMNMQEDTWAIHHFTLPWTPAQIQQRNGRGLRQGNNNECVGIHTYFAKGSFDAMRHQALERKADWIGDLWRGTADDYINEAAGATGGLEKHELKILLSPDPESARKLFDQDNDQAMRVYNEKRRLSLYRDFARILEQRRKLARIPAGTAPYLGLQKQIQATKDRLRQSELFDHGHLLDDPTMSSYKMWICGSLHRVFIEGDYMEMQADVAWDFDPNTYRKETIYVEITDVDKSREVITTKTMVTSTAHKFKTMRIRKADILDTGLKLAKLTLEEIDQYRKIQVDIYSVK